MSTTPTRTEDFVTDIINTLAPLTDAEWAEELARLEQLPLAEHITGVLTWLNRQRDLRGRPPFIAWSVRHSQLFYSPDKTQLSGPYVNAISYTDADRQVMEDIVKTHKLELG